MIRRSVRKHFPREVYRHYYYTDIPVNHILKRQYYTGLYRMCWNSIHGAGICYTWYYGDFLFLFFLVDFPLCLVFAKVFFFFSSRSPSRRDAQRVTPKYDTRVRFLHLVVWMGTHTAVGRYGKRFPGEIMTYWLKI